MLRREGLRVDCYLHGLSWLEAIRLRGASRRHRAIAAFASTWLRWLRRYDVIIVSDTIGIAREAELLEPLRSLDRPLLFYEVFALSGSRYWMDQFPSSALRQFDGFLVVSGIHDDPIAADSPPIFEIGLELLEEPFDRQSKPFVAMFDFERPGYEFERDMQREAIGSLSLPTFTLSGGYSFRSISAEYEKSAVAFVAFPEAFGIPIAQLQNRGALIASPHRHWAKRHALLPAGAVFDSNVANFTDNFIFYRDAFDLKERLSSEAARYRPDVVVRRLRQEQPSLVRGRRSELRRALDFASDLRRH